METDIGLPSISALLVTRNEEKFIERSFSSLLNQDYPKTKYEIIVVDGCSSDRTIDIIKNLAQKSDVKVRILENPKKILASGWNIGIKNASGDYVVRIDAHAEVPPDFISLNVKTIEDVKDVVCVGGKLVTKSLDGNNMITKVLASRFGVGNSSFRTASKAQYADTAVYGLYKKAIFDQVGYFDEGLERNQDIELHSRIRRNGGKFYFNPEITSVYYARNTLSKMMKQAAGNGKWNMILLKKGCSALSFRHFVPFCFVLFIIMSLILGLCFNTIFLYFLGAVLLLHLSMGMLASLEKTKDIKEIVLMPVYFLLLHLSYGFGFILGAIPKTHK